MDGVGCIARTPLAVTAAPVASMARALPLVVVTHANARAAGMAMRATMRQGATEAPAAMLAAVSQMLAAILVNVQRGGKETAATKVLDATATHAQPLVRLPALHAVRATAAPVRQAGVAPRAITMPRATVNLV